MPDHPTAEIGRAIPTPEPGVEDGKKTAESEPRFSKLIPVASLRVTNRAGARLGEAGGARDKPHALDYDSRWTSRREHAVRVVILCWVATAVSVVAATMEPPAQAAVPAACGKLLPPTQGVYYGAYPDFAGEDQVNLGQILSMDADGHRKAVWTYFGQWWTDQLPFPSAYVHLVWNAGKIPFIRLNPAKQHLNNPPLQPPWVDPGPYTTQDIAAGKYDTQLRTWADAARDTDIPILMEFGTEMNNFNEWSGRSIGGDTTTGYGDPTWPDGAERFRDAYRHIITLFREEGATNVTWFFHADTMYWAPDPGNELYWYYPGDDYIDWLGLSVYAFHKPDGGVASFSEKLASDYRPPWPGSYAEITSFSSKPLAILELGFNNVQGEDVRSAWVTDAAETIAAGVFPRIAAAAWWRVDFGGWESTPTSSPQFGAAYAKAFSNPVFDAKPVFSGNCLPPAPSALSYRHGVLRWQAVPDATSYEIWRGQKKIGSTNATSIHVRSGRGLRVRALDPLGAGPFS